MIHVKLNDGSSIESALKKYKSKFIKIGIVKELTERKTYKKKSESRRAILKKAKYREQKRTQNN